MDVYHNLYLNGDVARQSETDQVHGCENQQKATVPRW